MIILKKSGRGERLMDSSRRPQALLLNAYVLWDSSYPSHFTKYWVYVARTVVKNKQCGNHVRL